MKKMTVKFRDGGRLRVSIRNRHWAKYQAARREAAEKKSIWRTIGDWLFRRRPAAAGKLKIKRAAKTA